MLRARWWHFWGQVWLIRARRHELRARRVLAVADRLKKKAEEFFQRMGGR